METLTLSIQARHRIIQAAMRIEIVMQELRDSGIPATDEQRLIVNEARQHFNGLDFWQRETFENAARLELKKPYAVFALQAYTREQRQELADTCAGNLPKSCQSCPAQEDCAVVNRLYKKTEPGELYLQGLNF